MDVSTLVQALAPPVTPTAYSWFLTIFQYFPFITLIQWFLPWYPQGKTSVKSRLNLPGRYAWSFMEVVGPVNLLYALATAPSAYGPRVWTDVPTTNKLIAGLYVLHYFNRAIVTPLFCAPSMSPIHVVIMLSAVWFNYLNSSCLAGWLLGYGVPVRGMEGPAKLQSAPSMLVPLVGLLLFAFGMYGNICSEHTLFRLRREAAEKKDVAAAAGEGGKTRNKYDKVYVIPPAKGFFRTMLFPHYVCEWIEWFGFALVGFAAVAAAPATAAVNAAAAVTAPAFSLAPYYAPLASRLVARYGLAGFPLPPILSFVNIAMTTAVRASSGRAWYVKRFGEREVAGRGSVIPYFKWF
ncbi:hypothetical protein KEM52_005383 [Ascosphaera acerosa]|nr:hypothetical protein KEM52_005383 [Ascosphaera acerosa]